MPEPLWAAAVAMAKKHGVWLVARELRVNYASLKTRLAETERSRGGSRKKAADATFVELNPSSAWPDLAGGAVVELSSTDGARMVIRARSGDSIDVLGLAEAFWGRRA